eukprot:gnl/MRDRNA2_/MRDRNA2_237584_c0_seq1.p1 gnl/MRDRNA2_/MRDRNA2_237584_c0~~gnl/MRDRNA2_/MRDRNA2_237584_c0_seq1.p1  ORF type:complete len:493 (-),score=82.45 gnl/MRDRNA2_/MRDRNA2_237584_c0_seq1:43-1521(-)
MIAGAGASLARKAAPIAGKGTSFLGSEVPIARSGVPIQAEVPEKHLLNMLVIQHLQSEGLGAPLLEKVSAQLEEPPRQDVKEESERGGGSELWRAFQLALVGPGHLRLAVQAFFGNVFELQVDALTTVADLRSLVESPTGIPGHEQRLFYNQEELRDGEILALHGITPWNATREPFGIVNVAGKFAVAGTNGNAVQLWDIHNARLVSRLELGAGPIHCVSFDWWTMRVAAGSADGLLRVLSLATQACIHALKCGGPVHAVAVDWSSMQAIAGTHKSVTDGEILFWDLIHDQLVRVLQGHTGAVRAINIDWFDRRLVSASADGSLKLWNLDEGRCVATFRGHQRWVQAVVTHWPGMRALSASQDQTLRMWDLEECKCIVTMYHSGWVNCVDACWEKFWAISGSSDHTVKLWALRLGECLHTFHGHGSRVLAVAVDWQERRVFSTSYNAEIKLWKGHVNSDTPWTGDTCLWTVKSNEQQIDGYASALVITLPNS